MSNIKSRYPGAQPFEKNQTDIFFGREVEINNLRRKVNLVPLTVLYGKSGYGKSSLINAGLLPILEKEGNYECLRIRFNPYQKEQKNTLPLASTRTGLAAISNSKYLAQVIEKEDSLWRLNKEYYIENKGEKGLLLVFDQFEELFTYPEAAILEFRQQLAEVLYTTAPQRYWDRLENAYDQNKELLDKETLSLFQSPPAIKAVIAIRSDRIHLLEKLSDYIPLILKNLQELSPLDEQQAKKAVTEPAIIKGDFDSPRYTYSPEALDKIIHFLTDNGTEEVETTQLQIICHHLEQKIAASNAYEIMLEDVGQLEGVIENYYDSRIALIKNKEQAYAARRLVEEGLIFEEEERRLSIYEGQALRYFGLTSATLQLLVNSHLLRAEPSLRGGYTYELSHDTLVTPILKAKAIRIAKEVAITRAKAAKEQEAAIAKEQKKRRRAYLIAIVGIVLALLASIAAFTAYRQSNIAERARKSAAKSAYEANLLLAENYKIQGKYNNAISVLKTIKTEENEILVKKVKSRMKQWLQVQKLTHQSDSLIRIGEWGQAILYIKEAYDISPDANLQKSIKNKEVERDEKLKKYLKSAVRQKKIGRKDKAKDHYNDALKLLTPKDLRYNEIEKKLEN